MAAGGHFGFWALLGLAHTFARGIGAQFFLNTSKYPNPLSNLPLLSVVTGGPNMTLLLGTRFTRLWLKSKCRKIKLVIWPPFWQGTALIFIAYSKGRKRGAHTCALFAYKENTPSIHLIMFFIMYILWSCLRVLVSLFLLHVLFFSL